ncbi:MAG: hypothetical protein HY940_03285 [Gammaproteobacteria bacterium]|nr:hypothetical protein [Gammaproteobacteria bacterium]
MDQAGLVPFLILPLIGGYAFSITWTASLYNSAREDGQRIYFRAAFYGVFLTLCAICIHIILLNYSAGYSRLLATASEAIGAAGVVPEMWSTVAIVAILFISFMLGPLASHALNLLNVIIPSWNKYQLLQAIKHDELEELIYHSVKYEKPLLVTLDSGKVYVGWAVVAPNPLAAVKHIKMLPLLGGYRNKDTQQVEFTTNYHEIITSIEQESDLDHLTLDDFFVILPTKNIILVHGFDITAYNKFSTRGDEEPTDEADLSG